MKQFFTPNLTPAGRWVRAALGLSLITAGLLLSRQNGWICTVLVIAGGFTLYEAARGWCVMRACGIRTRV